MVYITALALVAGAVIGLAGGGRPRNIAGHRLRAWWLVVAGFALQLAADRVDVGSLGTVIVLAGAACLLVFAALNAHLVGIGIVAVGVAANSLVIALDNGMPVRPRAVVAAHLATSADEAVLAYGYRHHREGGADRLVPLADIIPIPPFREVVSFGDLILAIGAATTVAHLLRPSPRHAAKAGAHAHAGTNASASGTPDGSNSPDTGAPGPGG